MLGHFRGILGALLSLSLVHAAEAAAASAQVDGTLEVLVEDYPDRSSRTRLYVKSDSGRRQEVRLDRSHPTELVSGTRVRARGRLEGDLLALDSGSEGLQAISAPAALASLGVQRVLFLLVNFQDNTTQPFTQAEVQSLTGSIDAFYRENSFQQTSFSSTVMNWQTLPMTAGTACDTWGIKSQALAAASAAGIDLAAFNRYVYVYPRISCTWAGLAIVGGTPSDAWINGALDFRVVTHELGHNLGLGHAHNMNCDQTPISSTCTGNEYGDVADVMGNGSGHVNSFGKEKLGWFGAAGMPSITTAQASGNHLIEPFETATSGVKAIKIPAGINTSTGEPLWYHLEYRQLIGFDTVLSKFGGNQAAGVTIRRVDGRWGSYLLDMTPNSNTVATVYDTLDGALVAGASFSDPALGLTVSVSWANASGASVSVSFGPMPSPSPSPTPAPSPSPSPTVGTLSVSVSTDAPDYARGATARISAAVASGTTAVSGASVSFTITDPAGKVTQHSAVSGTDGKATIAFKILRKYPRGAYQVKATASSGSQSASGSTGFTVK